MTHGSPTQSKLGKYTFIMKKTCRYEHIYQYLCINTVPVYIFILYLHAKQITINVTPRHSATSLYN
jgi:hypothetical protein